MRPATTVSRCYNALLSAAAVVVALALRYLNRFAADEDQRCCRYYYDDYSDDSY